MLDPHTGAVKFDEPDVAVAPTLTRDAFHAAAWAGGATPHVLNEPFCSWNVGRTLRSGAVDFAVVLFFEGQRLTMLSLMNVDPAFGTGWGDYTREKEQARRASHDAWLATQVGRKRKFRWGRIWSGYDEKAAFSSVVLHYAT